MKVRLQGPSLDGLPLLDALLPCFDYSSEKLMHSPFGDAWLTAALKADALLMRAAEILQPLGIERDDLILVLHAHMKQRLKEQRAKAKR